MSKPSPVPRVAVWAVIVAAVVVVLAVRGDVVVATLKSPAALLRVGAIVVALVALSFVLRRFVDNALARALVMAVPVVALLWLLVVPYFTDETVTEALPGAPVTTSDSRAAEPAPAEPAPAQPAPAASPTTTTSPPQPSGPLQLSNGVVEGIDHRASGSAAVYRLPDDSHIVRLEDVDIQNGPDYRLYLVPGTDRESPDGGLDLGALKANRGSHNYPIPPEVDATSGPFTVLVWCRAFAVPVANATQIPA